MKYPTIEEVNLADHEQICRWWRFLGSPGAEAIGREDYLEVSDRQILVMNRIAVRLKHFGGFTLAISKKIGWDRG